MTKTLVAAALAALGLVATGCGGSEDEDPTVAWAGTFCTVITSWTEDLQGVTEQFSSTSSLSRDELEEAASDVEATTDELVDDLRGLGAPPTESGEAIRSSIDLLSTTLENEAAKIEDAASDVTGLAEVPDAIISITTSLSAMGTAFATGLQAIRESDVTGELEAAFEEAPACVDIPG